MQPHMKIRYEGGHAFHDGVCLQCQLPYGKFSDQGSPRRGEQCPGHAPEAPTRMFIDEQEDV